MLPVNCGSHSDYQNFVVNHLRKYYPNPDSLARSTWDIIDRFWNLDLTYTDEKLKNRYSVFGPKPRTPSCMHRSYLLSLDFKVTSLTEWAAQLKINPLFRIEEDCEELYRRTGRELLPDIRRFPGSSPW